MTRIFRKAYSVVGVVLMLQYVLQLYFMAGAIFTITKAGDNQGAIYSAFKNADNSFLTFHALNGDLVGLFILVFFVVSLAARLPRRVIGLNGLLFALFILQLFLPYTGIPALSALHGINALILIGLTGYLTFRSWAFGRPAEAPATPSS